MTTQLFRNYIGGEWVAGASTSINRNPSDLADVVGEVARAGQIFHFFAGEVLRHGGEMVPSVRPGVDVEITREPLGVIGLITPWNAPMRRRDGPLSRPWRITRKASSMVSVTLWA